MCLLFVKNVRTNTANILFGRRTIYFKKKKRSSRDGKYVCVYTLNLLLKLEYIKQWTLAVIPKPIILNLFNLNKRIQNK